MDEPKRVDSVLADPSAQAVARVYADAFLGAVGGDAAGALEELQSFLEDVLASQPEFEALLLSGIISRDEKIGLIDRVVSQFGTDHLTNFLRVLANHDRLDLLPVILQESQLKHEAQQGRKRVQVTSAQPLSAESSESIGQRLRSAFSFEPIIEASIDPLLLGGLVIRVENTVYDSSLRTRMKQLRARLRERSLHEIQSGRDRFSHPEGD